MTLLHRVRRHCLLVFIVCGVVLLDIGTKIIARSFELAVIENYQGPFGVFSHSFIIPLSIVALYVFYAVYRNVKISLVERISLALIIGGGIANLGERIVNGFITDIFSVWIAAWNVADIAIVIGVSIIGGLLLRTVLRTSDTDKKYT